MDVLKDAIDGHLSPSPYLEYLVESTVFHLSPSPYLEYLVESTVFQLSLAAEDIKVIRRQCINYIVALSKELHARLPDNLEAL
jgi:hypothetical protein